MKEISNETWNRALHILTKFNSEMKQRPKPVPSLERSQVQAQLAKIKEREKRHPPTSVGERQAMDKAANRLKQVEYDRERGAYDRPDEA